MYEDAFETKFLKATEALYHEEGNRYMQETDVSYHLFQHLYPRGWMGSKKALIPACPLYNQLSKLACPGQVKVYLFSFLVPRLTTCCAYRASNNEQFHGHINDCVFSLLLGSRIVWSSLYLFVFCFICKAPKVAQLHSSSSLSTCM